MRLSWDFLKIRILDEITVWWRQIFLKVKRCWWHFSTSFSICLSPTQKSSWKHRYFFIAVHKIAIYSILLNVISRILERSVSQSSLGEPEVPKIEALARLGSNSSFSNLVGRDHETPTNEFPQADFQISFHGPDWLKRTGLWFAEGLKLKIHQSRNVQIVDHQFLACQELGVIKV